MACEIELLSRVPLFALLDADERGVLAASVEVRAFARNQKIFRMGEPGGRAYVLLSGRVSVVTIDDDKNEVVVDEPGKGDFFGFASMLEQTAHQTSAIAIEDSEAIEIDRSDISTLLHAKPSAGMDMLAVLGRQIHAAQHLVRHRVTRNVNALIEDKETVGERIADAVARFGGSWRFIISFAIVLTVYAAANVVLRERAWDPYPFILLNLFLSMLASLQAPVIMMSQNRQDARDRVRAELDYNVNLKAEVEVSQILAKVNNLEDRIDALLARR